MSSLSFLNVPRKCNLLKKYVLVARNKILLMVDLVPTSNHQGEIKEQKALLVEELVVQIDYIQGKAVVYLNHTKQAASYQNLTLNSRAFLQVINPSKLQRLQENKNITTEAHSSIKSPEVQTKKKTFNPSAPNQPLAAKT